METKFIRSMNTIGSVCLAVIIIAIAGLLFVDGFFFYQWRGWFKRLYHDALGCHRPTDSVEWNGWAYTSKCIYCGRDIVRDAYGNWHLKEEMKDGSQIHY